MFYLCVCLLVAVVFAQDTIVAPVVNTTEGEVQGSSADDGDYYVFYGIPYAGPTPGKNRFKPPTPPLQRSGVFHAVNSGIVCAHATLRGFVGVEDCLVLNIHTKDLTTPKPVMIILLGDEYGSVDPTVHSLRRLVEDDMVMVTMNYRLSVFGFLCLGIPDAPGNAGLKDVMQGLRWIKENIAGFGGDPDNIMLFGHGSGAAMVDLITLTPASVNFVHKAVTQSGSALAPWAVAYEPILHAKVFARRLGYSVTSSQEIADSLVSTNLILLTAALLNFEFLNNSVLFAPCLENPELEDTFLTEAPIDIIRSGKYNHIPILTGYTDQEGTIRAAQAVNNGWLEKMEQNFVNFVPVDLEFASVEEKTAVADTVKAFYFDTNAINMNTIREYLRSHGDATIMVPVIRGARERALTSRESIRLMDFSYKGTKHSDWIYTQIPNEGARHGSLLYYLFDYDLKELYDETARDALLWRYTLFATTGDPTAPNTGNVIWDPLTRSSINYLYVFGSSDTDADNTMPSFGQSARSNPYPDQMTFWNDLYTNHYRALIPITPSGADKLFSAVFLLLLTQFVTRLL